MNTTWLCDCSFVMLRWNQFQFKNWHLLTMKYLNWDLTIQQRERLWKGRWKIDFASFRTFSRLSQVAQLFKRRKFMLQLKRRNCARVQTGMINLSPCRSRSQVNLKFGHLMSYLHREGNEICKKSWCACKVVVFLIKTIASLTFLLSSRRRFQ